jgi:hypothetical protein
LLSAPAITMGKEYEVMAVVQFHGLALFQTVHDDECPGWLPTWLYDVVDASIPHEWICTTIYEQGWIAIGPEFVVKDDESYEQMVQREPDAMAKFWERLTRKPSASDD